MVLFRPISRRERWEVRRTRRPGAIALASCLVALLVLSAEAG